MEPTALHKFRQKQMAAKAQKMNDQIANSVSPPSQPAPPAEEKKQIAEVREVEVKPQEASSLIKTSSPPEQKAQTPLEARLAALRSKYPHGLGYQLAPYQPMQEHESHLDIANLVTDAKFPIEKAQFFVCTICSMIANDAKECADCNTVYCSQCIIPWQQRDGCCPKKCQGSEKVVNVTNLHRYAKADLNSLKFKCVNSHCDYVGHYSDALKHLDECQERFQVCPNGCGVGVLGRDIEYHNLMQCPKYQPICPTCGLEEPPLADKDRTHNCIEALKQKIAEMKVSQAQPALNKCDEYVPGFDIKKVKCGECHSSMTRRHNRPDSYDGGARCDLCHDTPLEDYAFFMNCEQCCHDVCFACALQQQNLLPYEDDDDTEYSIKYSPLGRLAGTECARFDCETLKHCGQISDHCMFYNEDALDAICLYCKLKTHNN